jgi:MoxR-like ATPase
METTTDRDEAKLVEKLNQGRERILHEIRKIIVGQDDVIEQVLIALFTGGHVLITGVPGLAKTLLIRTLAQILDLSFNRIQFTPDLMPADIIGTDIIEEDRMTGRRSLSFIKGPVFANVILADEINRTPPKTQAALLEAMQEHRVTAGGKTYKLEEPFFVLATQNPIELEGTYPLPEAQLDRFMFNVIMDYLNEDQEVEVVTNTTSNFKPSFDRVVTGADVVEFQQVVRRVPVSEQVARYAVRLVASSRPGNGSAPDFVKKWVSWGAGLRASQYLILGGKARALLQGRYNVSVKDIQALALPVLRHRVLTNFYAESERIKSDEIVRRLLEVVPEPKSGL